MKSIIGVILGIGAKFQSIVSTTQGFFIALALAIFDFLAGYKIAIASVFFFVVVDMIWGIIAAKTQGKYTQSALMRDTIVKIGGFSTALVFTMVLENMILGSHVIGIEEGANNRWAVDMIAFLIGLEELWSTSGNILIVRPQFILFKFFRMSLVGEIARKLHISEDEVKEVFNSNGDFRNIKHEN